VQVPLAGPLLRGTPRAAAPVPAAFSQALHVLCLDNEPEILEGMAALLGRWGLSCDLALNASEAQTALRARRPDVILADFHLGAAQDGLEILDALRADCVMAPPAALITADGSDELKQRARQRGVAVLHKPVKPAALRALLAALARQVHADEQRETARP
jgi:CheY-like chemotaxis protein